MIKSVSTLLLSAAIPLLALSACGAKSDNKAELAALDDKLTEAKADPAMNEALSDQILVDPDLTDSANANAVRDAGGAPNGMVPTGANYDGIEDAELAGKGLLQAPAPRVMSADDECTSCGGANDGMTLGAKAEQQQARRGKGTCDAKLTYDMRWANRMPAEFPVYPRAALQEAAGVEGGLCDIRVVSFTTAAPLKNVVDYYYTRAKRSGYNAEYLLRDGEHVLGGTRDNDDGAYFITFASRGKAGTAVDIVASNGR